MARERADALQARLAHRLAELEQERQLSALPPVVVGGALVVPEGLLAHLAGESQTEPDVFARETQRVEALAMQAVLDRGRKGLSPSPPSEPCWRFSRTRLSSRWLPHRDWLACT